MASAINPITSQLTPAGTSATPATATAPSEEMFLQLLVAQIKNQDPLNPADSMQFVSQLAQFSELEQVIAIRGDIEQQAATGQSNSSGTQPAGTQANNQV